MTQAILYVSGQIRERYSGYGIHGYTFTNEVPKKGTGSAKVAPTTTGYSNKPTPEDVRVTVSHYIDIDYLCHTPMTAPAATDQGIVAALKYTLDRELETVVIWICNAPSFKVIKDWVDGDPLPASATHASMDVLFKQLCAKGCKVFFNTTEKNQKNPGALKADMLAVKGAFRAAHGSDAELFGCTSEPQGYWNPSPEIHPLLKIKKMFFYASAALKTPGVYCLGGNMMPDEYEGKRSNDTTYAITILKNPNPVLERIRDLHCHLAGNDEIMVMIYLTKVFQASCYTDIEKFGDSVLNSESVYRQDLTYINGDIVTREFRPVGLAIRSMTEINTLHHALEEFNQQRLLGCGGEHLQITDITDSLYETILVPKAKKMAPQFQLKKQFGVGSATFKVNAGYRDKGAVKYTALELVFGSDLPDRNELKRLDEMGPKVFLLTLRTGPDAFTFCTVIETQNGDQSIWCAPFTSYRIIAEKINR